MLKMVKIIFEGLIFCLLFLLVINSAPALAMDPDEQQDHVSTIYSTTHLQGNKVHCRPLTGSTACKDILLKEDYIIKGLVADPNGLVYAFGQCNAGDFLQCINHPKRAIQHSPIFHTTEQIDTAVFGVDGMYLFTTKKTSEKDVQYVCKVSLQSFTDNPKFVSKIISIGEDSSFPKQSRCQRYFHNGIVGVSDKHFHLKVIHPYSEDFVDISTKNSSFAGGLLYFFRGKYYFPRSHSYDSTTGSQWKSIGTGEAAKENNEDDISKNYKTYLETIQWEHTKCIPNIYIQNGLYIYQKDKVIRVNPENWVTTHTIEFKMDAGANSDFRRMIQGSDGSIYAFYSNCIYCIDPKKTNALKSIISNNIEDELGESIVIAVKQSNSDKMIQRKRNSPPLLGETAGIATLQDEAKQVISTLKKNGSIKDLNDLRSCLKRQAITLFSGFYLDEQFQVLGQFEQQFNFENSQVKTFVSQAVDFIKYSKEHDKENNISPSDNTYYINEIMGEIWVDGCNIIKDKRTKGLRIQLFNKIHKEAESCVIS